MRRCLVLAAALLASACSLAEGPLGFVPGGPFEGAPERGAETDWSFAVALDSVDVQIDSSPPRTVRTGIVVLDGVPHLPVTFAPLKRWPAVVRERPSVVLRADGRLFERTAVEVVDPAQRAALVAAGRAKYGAPFHASWAPVTQWFRLESAPPPRSATAPRPS